MIIFPLVLVPFVSASATIPGGFRSEFREEAIAGSDDLGYPRLGLVLDELCRLHNAAVTTYAASALECVTSDREIIDILIIFVL